MKRKVGMITLVTVLAAMMVGVVGLPAHASVPAFVQVVVATPQTPQTTVTTTFASAQIAGNTNILAIGWNDTTRSISAVTDSKGNAYQVAVPTFRNTGNGLSQAIYYAKNIVTAAANGNTVTVTFNGAAVAVDLRIMEYSGLDVAAPFDVGTSAGGNQTATPSSGNITTTNASDLLIGAGMTGIVFTAAGANYTNRMITYDGDIAEDRVVNAAGSYSATAQLSKVGSYVVQVAAFKAAGAPPPPPPAPAANFTGVPTSGTTPLTVAFTDTSSNTPTSWSWTFGDGGTSTAQNPSHTYAVTGTYTVALTATNAGGGNTNTKTGYITVNSPPPPSGWPDATNTGVPPGTQLTVVNGDMTVSTPNTVVDAKDIRGCVVVTTPGVVIKNSKISCGGFEAIGSWDGYYSGTRLTVQDSEVDCQNGTGRTAIGDTLITALRLNIHGCENGFDINQEVAVQDSFIHDLANSAEAHTDGLQLASAHLVNGQWVNGALNVLVKHNTIQADAATSAMISNPLNDQNITVQDNLMSGGAYTLYCDYNGTATNYQVIGNHVSTRSFPNGGQFGPWTGCTDEAVVSGNVWHDGPNAGQPLP